MTLHDKLKGFSSIVWNTCDFWGRIFFLSIVCWPLLLAVVAAGGGGTTIIALLALIPFLTLVLGIAIYPVIDVAVLALEEGRAILKWIAAIIGVELVIGAYLSAVPLSSDSGLVPLLVLVIAAIILLSLSQKLRTIRYVLWTALIVLTLIFVMGGREKAKGLIPDGLGEQDTKQSPTPQGYMEDGYWIPDVPFTLGPETRAKTYRKELLEGREFEIVTDCRKMDEYVVTIPPGKIAQIRHIDHGPYKPKISSCSYGFGNYRAPVNGAPAGMVARPRFEERFFFTDIPPLVTAFYTTDASGKGKTPAYIKKLGGSIYITNPTNEDVRVHMQKNLTQALYANKLDRDGIGWDGSVEEFHVTIFD